MGFFLPQMPFSPLMKNTAQSAFLEFSPSVEGDRDVVCDPPLSYQELLSSQQYCTDLQDY